MITYTFDEDNNTVTKVQELSFDCNIPVNFAEYITKPKLHKTIRELNAKYNIKGSIYESLKHGLIELETRKGTASKRRQGSDMFTKKFIGQKHEENIKVDKSFDDQVGLGVIGSIDGIRDESLIFKELKTRSSKESSSFQFSEKASLNKYTRDYLIFLYLVKKQQLFRCINPLTMNIDIVDSGNLHHHIKHKAHVILPVEEYLYRGDINNVKGDTYRAYDLLERTHNTISSYNNENMPDEIKQSIKVFERDTKNLQSKYPYIGTEAMLEICREGLDDSRTSRLAIESKKSYRLVKPTIKEHEKDDNIEINTNNFGKIEIKKHTVGKYTIKHTEYTPTYMVLKLKEKSV